MPCIHSYHMSCPSHVAAGRRGCQDIQACEAEIEFRRHGRARTGRRLLRACVQDEKMHWHHPAHGVQLYGASITLDGQLVESENDALEHDDDDDDAAAFTPDEQRARAHSTFLRLALPPYTVHFKSPTYLHPPTLDRLDKRVVKETLRRSARDAWVRTGIGCDARVWHELVLLLKAAIPSIEKRSFAGWEATSNTVDYDSTSGALIAQHYPGLWRDVERLNDVISIARNVLTVGVEAQDMASAYCADLELFRLINCCVRVTARGYDGNAGTGDEEKWQWVVNAYKKLLITSLQLLNNLVAQNERKKSMLWQSLFDHVSDAGFREEHVLPRNIAPPKKAVAPISSSDILLAYGSNGPNQRVSPLEFEAAQLIFDEEGFKSLPANAVAARKHAEPNGYVYFTARHKAILMRDFEARHKRQPTLAEIHRNIPHYWHEGLSRNSRLWSEWQERFDKALEAYRDDEEDYADYLRDPDGWQDRFLEGRAPPPPLREISITTRYDPERREDIPFPSFDLEHTRQCTQVLQSGMASEVHDPTQREFLDPSVPTLVDPRDPRDAQARFDDRMPFTAAAGSQILESGKGELMRRLDGWVDVAKAATRTATQARREKVDIERRASSTGAITSSQPRRRRSSNQAVEDAFAEESLDEEEDEDEDDGDDEEEEEEEDYPGSTEDGRGLLTDVPLILGPSEIEVLPMLIMSGLVAPPVREGDRDPCRETDEHEGAKFRCHLLLSSTSGRNLLRELLIFVAAWDLREEELYFKFMVRILEAILSFGLMPYAYHAFRDRSRSKDIISPAQAVIVKLLTWIFRGRNDTIRRNIRGETVDGQLSTFADRKARGIITEPSQGNATEKADWLRAQHRNCVAWKQQLGLLPSPVDLRLLNFIFTEFRQHIIPQTCALIFLQGQIHRGKASAEDFPLNLWDMERMYEGVYQFLEFFAVLTEDPTQNLGKDALGARAERLKAVHGDDDLTQYIAGNGVFMGDETAPVRLNGSLIWTAKDCDLGGLSKGWKELLAQWHMASELVTLLRELEGGIPKVGGSVATTAGSAAAIMPQIDASTTSPAVTMNGSLALDSVLKGGSLTGASAAVKQAFDLANGDASKVHHQLPASLTPGLLPPLQPHPIFEAETPLAYPEDHANFNPAPLLPPLAQGALTAPPDLQAPPHHDQDEPSDFEWRNLKKLTVLVLSSLVFKQQMVKDQVREYRGLETLVECCRQDENNPYIRDHAIMCLRFAVEGSHENAKVLIELANAKKEREAQARRQANTLERGRSSALSTRRSDPLPALGTKADDFETFFDESGRACIRRKRDNAIITVDGRTDPVSISESLLMSPAVTLDDDDDEETVLDRRTPGTKETLPATSKASTSNDAADHRQTKQRRAEETFEDELVRKVVGYET